MGPLNRLVEAIREARHCVALTGAGISAEIGIPTFRGGGGLWERHRPEELATPEAFRRDPEKVWRWYAWRQELVFSKGPGPAHVYLARLEEAGYVKAVITQNVDGLHTLAGSRNVVELHGNIRRVRCTRCGHREGLAGPVREIPPRCARCGGLLRPDVVWFGEELPRDALSRALEETEKSDLFLVIGTSGAVYPAAALPALAARRGAVVVEINPEETPITRVASMVFRAPAGEVLRAVYEELL